MLNKRATSMFYPAIFIGELILLFFLSQLLIRSLSIICYRMFRKEHAVIYVLALLFSPGTLLHELAHMLVAALLFVRVGKIELFPYKTEDGIRLGSVVIAHTDPFRRSLIGLAPLFFGTAGIFLAGYYFSSFPLAPWYLNILLLIFVIFEIGNTMFSSKKDVEGIPALVIVLTLFLVAGYIIGIRIPDVVWAYIDSARIQAFFQQLSFYMLAPLGINGAILLLANILSKRR